jgi:hypothetical protein
VRAQPHPLQPVHAALEQLTPAQTEVQVQLQRLGQQGGHGVARVQAAVGVLEDGLDAVQLCRAAAVGAARQRLRDRSRSSAPPAWPMRRIFYVSSPRSGRRTCPPRADHGKPVRLAGHDRGRVSRHPELDRKRFFALPWIANI